MSCFLLSHLEILRCHNFWKVIKFKNNFQDTLNLHYNSGNDIENPKLRSFFPLLYLDPRSKETLLNQVDNADNALFWMRLASLSTMNSNQWCNWGGAQVVHAHRTEKMLPFFALC